MTMGSGGFNIPYQPSETTKDFSGKPHVLHGKLCKTILKSQEIPKS